ncbi:MAG: hypothetical protein AAF921_19980 [Cyanobacteria bacterium P01_D01_bin.44]
MMNHSIRFFPPLLMISRLVVMGAIAPALTSQLALPATAEDLPPDQIRACYMQTEDGRVVDLTHLCGQPDSEDAAQTNRPEPPNLPAQRVGRGAARGGHPVSTR